MTDEPRAWGGTYAQRRAAVLIIVGLVVIGVVLGLLWAWWSPAGPPGVQLKAGTVQIDESETFAAADGRFGILTAVIGLVAGIGIWFARSVRGPLTALALGVGGFLGAEVTGLVGHLVGGGTNDGPPNTEIPHLPLNVHLTGLFMIEGILAVLLYSVLAAFAVHDDLGRPDPARDQARAKAPAWLGGRAPEAAVPDETGTPAQPGGLVQPEGFAQGGWADRNAPGLSQQHNFPPQYPSQGP